MALVILKEILNQCTQNLITRISPQLLFIREYCNRQNLLLTQELLQLFSCIQIASKSN